MSIDYPDINNRDDIKLYDELIEAFSNGVELSSRQHRFIKSMYMLKSFKDSIVERGSNN